jgi:hypothetical protein
MKLKQLFELDSKTADKKSKTEEEELTAITSKDYTEWCNQIGMKGEEVSVDDFREAAWEVIDNDPKLGSTSEADKGKIVSKLWKMHHS